MVVCRPRGCRSRHVGTAHRWPTPAPLGATARLRLHVGCAAAVPPAASGAAASAIPALDSPSSGCEFVDLKGEEWRPFCLFVIPPGPDGDDSTPVPVKHARDFRNPPIDFDHFNVSRIDSRQHLHCRFLPDAKGAVGCQLPDAVDKHAYATRLLTTSKPNSFGRPIPYPDSRYALK